MVADDYAAIDSADAGADRRRHPLRDRRARARARHGRREHHVGHARHGSALRGPGPRPAAGLRRQASLALAAARTVDTMRHAFNDSLTGLANRALFLDRLEPGAARAPARGPQRHRALPRPRPLQAGQRHARARRGRRAARRRRRPAPARACAGGDRRPPRRRRVRRPARGRRRRGEAAARRRSGSRERSRRRSRSTTARSTSPPASASRSRRRARPTTCCATPTWPCTAPRRGGRAATRCSSPACTPTLLARLELEADLQRALERRRASCSTTSRSSTLRDGRAVGVEALAALGAPERGLGAALRLHPGGRGDGPDRADRPTGCCARPAGRPRVWQASAARPPAGGQRQPVAAGSCASDGSSTSRAARSTKPACRPATLLLEITETALMQRHRREHRRSCARSSDLGIGSRSTTSARATRRCATCSGSRSTS